ncbi:MAG: type II secretion system protein GspC [Desulfosalsimonadaceae bacterium]|nr:type II secretion system protein GspC [Desulfosalsimonadaceae bacterium]
MIKHLFSLLNLLLIAVFIFFSVSLGYQMLSAALNQASSSDLAAVVETEADANNTRSVNNQPQVRQLAAYQSITTRDLFKTQQALKSDKSLDIDPDKLKQTSLNLKLLGTITGGVTDSEYAVIEDVQKRKQGLYRAGDAIVNARIKAILRKKVVLSVDGKDEVLLMDEDKNKPKKQVRPGFPDASDEFDPALPDESGEIDESVNIDREKINDSLQNINQLMSQVKVRPHFKDGKPDGLLLSHVQQNSIFNEMGLQNGDIVKGVNGKEIQSVDDALKFYDSLKSSTSVEIQIERQNDMMTIGYQIKE